MNLVGRIGRGAIAGAALLASVAATGQGSMEQRILDGYHQRFDAFASAQYTPVYANPTVQGTLLDHQIAPVHKIHVTRIEVDGSALMSTTIEEIARFEYKALLTLSGDEVYSVSFIATDGPTLFKVQLRAGSNRGKVYDPKSMDFLEVALAYLRAEAPNFVQNGL